MLPGQLRYDRAEKSTQSGWETVSAVPPKRATAAGDEPRMKSLSKLITVY
jgi:hypothetical protein